VEKLRWNGWACFASRGTKWRKTGIRVLKVKDGKSKSVMFSDTFGPKSGLGHFFEHGTFPWGSCGYFAKS
jgi:hypothetical protein